MVTSRGCNSQDKKHHEAFYSGALQSVPWPETDHVFQASPPTTFLIKCTFLDAGSFFTSFLVSFPTGTGGEGGGCFAAELDLSRPTE